MLKMPCLNCEVGAIPGEAEYCGYCDSIRRWAQAALAARKEEIRMKGMNTVKDQQTLRSYQEIMQLESKEYSETELLTMGFTYEQIDRMVRNGELYMPRPLIYRKLE